MFNIMFDKLKEVKYFEEMTDFKNLYCNLKYFKEIKRLQSLQKADGYLEPKQVSMMGFFVNILNSLLFLQSKLHHRCSTGLYIDHQKY